MKRTLLAGSAVFLALVAGCYTGGDVTSTSRVDPAASAPVSSVDPTLPPDPTKVTGVPCDVATVLAKDCVSCHAAKPVGGAPDALMNYDDMMAPSVTDPTKTAAQVSLARMMDKKNPMPPDGAAAADLAVLAAWINAGSPQGTTACNATPLASIYATPVVCTSTTNWTRGDRGSFSMRPGGACTTCHSQRGEGPEYPAAGTVYKTAHEPDDCNGIDGTAGSGITVVITDAANKTFTATVNAVGNFAFPSTITMPYKARVVSGGKTRSMSAPQTNGDCNTCHTETGTTTEKGLGKEPAPGRVMAP